MFCLYLISDCVSDSLSMALSFWIVLSSQCCKTRCLIIFSLNVRSGRRCFVCCLCQEQLDCIEASCLSLSLRIGQEHFDQGNKVVSNLIGEQRSTRRWLSSPDLPALYPYFTDEMIQENRRVTRRRKEYHLPQRSIEPAESLWEG